MARTTIAELLARARSGPERLEPAEALAAQREGALVVDLRSVDERERAGVIPGALHVPRSVLEWRLDPESEHHNPDACDLERQVVLVCADGYSSSLAAATLQELGFGRATDLVGGFKAWAAAGLPTEPGRGRSSGEPAAGEPPGQPPPSP